VAGHRGSKEHYFKVGNSRTECYIIDQRAHTTNGSVPPENIIGAFEVKEGELLPESYRRNPSHLILSPDGFFNLGAELQKCLVEELSASVATGK